MRVVEPSTTPGMVRIDQDHQEPTSQLLQGSRGLPRGARVHAKEKIAPEVDEVSHHCLAKRRGASESLLPRTGWCSRLRRMPARNPENASPDRSPDWLRPPTGSEEPGNPRRFSDYSCVHSPSPVRRHQQGCGEPQYLRSQPCGAARISGGICASVQATRDASLTRQASCTSTLDLAPRAETTGVLQSQHCAAIFWNR